MKKILFLFLILSTFAFAQTQKVRVDSYNGSNHTYYYSKTYTNTQTDTTEFINFADADSVKFFISSNDSTNVKYYLIYGDGVFSNVTTSAIDSLITTTTGWKSIDWHKIVSSCGNTIIGAKLKLNFQSSGNAASSSGAKYSIFIKKYKK